LDNILSQTNESAKVAKSKKFLHLNKTLHSAWIGMAQQCRAAAVLYTDGCTEGRGAIR